MYTETTKSFVKHCGEWLQGCSWDFFSTITYKWDTTPKRNRNIMRDLENHLCNMTLSYQLFWVMEQTSIGYHTHNHLLIENPLVVNHINQFLEDRNLVDRRFVKHIPYQKHLGAGYYVSKYINSPSIDYDFIYSFGN